jgi:hypothetical protein
MEASPRPRYTDPEAPATMVVSAGATVHELPVTRSETVPRDQYLVLADELGKTQDRVKSLTDVVVGKDRKIGALSREIDDLLEQSADREKVMGILEFWHEKAGKGPRIKLTMSGQRPRCVRWMCRHWTPREICMGIIGLLATDYYKDRGLDDIHFMCTTKGKWDETKVEQFIAHGRKVRGLPEDWE